MELHPTLKKVSSISEMAYRSMIQTQLARLLDLDTVFNFDLNNDRQNDSKNYKEFSIFGSTLTHESICMIGQLIEYIQRDDNIVKEGIFRKAGLKSRQQELRKLISMGQTIDMEQFNVYDCCDLLKSFLKELPQSLLTNQYQELFIMAIIKLNNEQKKLDTIRLIILLLPIVNRCFLYELLTLFNSIANYSQKNRMNITNIATIFSPTFFHYYHHNQHHSKQLSSPIKSIQSSSVKKKSSSESIQNILLQLNAESIQCLSFMIENVRLIFEPPEQLINDAQLYLSNHYSNQNQNSVNNNMNSVTDLSAIPTPKFCFTDKQSYSSTKSYTEKQLAELYAQMQIIAQQQQQQLQSPKQQQQQSLIKKKLKKFNHNNNGLSSSNELLKRDKEQQKIIKQTMMNKMKNSSSNKKFEENKIKTLFKKIMTPNSERKSKFKSSSTTSTSNNTTPISTKKLINSKNSTKKLLLNNSINNSTSPISIVPVEEPISMPPSSKSLSIKTLKTKNNLLSSSKIPIAVITPNLHKHNKIEENFNQKLPTKIHSLPASIYNINNNNDNNENNQINDTENIPKKRVKYLTLKYEEMISSQINNNNNNEIKRSRIPIVHSINQKNYRSKSISNYSKF